MPSFINFLAILIAYLIGSLSSAIIVCKIMGLPDPRTQGSCNPGATNVLRIGGKKAALITLFGDLLKGLIPVLIAKYLGFGNTVIALIALAAFLGHIYPIFFGFEGGKGVATMLGCLLALSWPTAICWMLTWVIMALIFRYSSFAAITSSIFAPIYIAFFMSNLAWISAITIMSIILINRHKNNIIKLMQGKESKIGKKN